MFYFVRSSALWYLLRADLHVLRSQIVDGWINIGIWSTVSLAVFTYLLPSANALGMFLVPGCVVAAQLFDIYSNVVFLLSDFENDQVMLQRMTLPVPASVIWLEQIVYCAIRMLLQSMLVMPLSWILLGNLFDVTQLSIFKFCITIIATSVLFSVGGLCLASITPSLAHMRNAWSRVIFPLWFLGGYMFSWKTLNASSPIMSYIDLLNPVIYASEAMRCAILGQEGSLPFWYSLGIIGLFSLLGTIFVIHRLNRRLDVP